MGTRPRLRRSSDGGDKKGKTMPSSQTVCMPIESWEIGAAAGTAEQAKRGER